MGELRYSVSLILFDKFLDNEVSTCIWRRWCAHFSFVCFQSFQNGSVDATRGVACCICFDTDSNTRVTAMGDNIIISKKCRATPSKIKRNMVVSCVAHLLKIPNRVPGFAQDYDYFIIFVKFSSDDRHAQTCINTQCNVDN